MPDFTFTGAEERYYTDHGLTAHPGDVVSMDAPLDDMWVSADAAPAAAVESELNHVAEPEHVAEPVAEPAAEDHSSL